MPVVTVLLGGPLLGRVICGWNRLLPGRFRSGRRSGCDGAAR